MEKMDQLSIRVINSLKELQLLSDQWNRLLAETAIDNIFLTWEWIYTWCKHYLGTNNLWIMLVCKGHGQLVGIAPLYIRRVRAHGGLTLREVRFLGTEEACPAYLDFIVSEKNKKAVLQQIYSYFHADGKEAWDILTLSEILAESSSIDSLYSLIEEDGKVVEVVGLTACPVIGLTGQLEDFLEWIGGNERYNLQRKRKRLEQAGRVVYERVSSHQEIEKGMDTFISLHQIRWERKGSTGAFGNRRFEMFHREICRVFSDKGWVHLDFLQLDGEMIAGIYAYSYKDRYYYYLPGFNPTAVPQASPGILLLFHCIKEAILKGYKEFDLLRGAAGYKVAWASATRRCLTLRHYNRHVRAAAFKMLEGGKETMKVLLR